MFQPQRHAEILQTLEHQGGVRVSDLASRMDVTEETIRRDLLKLESDGRLKRIHGGAIPHISERDPVPYQHRQMEQVDAKRSIARCALNEIEEEDVVFFDGSTTAFQLARIFPDIRCTVLTHSEPIFRELSNLTNVELVSTGGVYDRRHASFAGPLAEQMLTSIHITKAIMGCKGLDFKRGFSDASVRHMNLKRAVIHHAEKVILLADHSKMDARSRYFFATIEDVDVVITDPRISREHDLALSRAGLRVLKEK
ncbi:DeoR/GlpR family DNA-binding transcription regulator [Kiritimatiellaeota bacterium B1221]|nr:DeoR/GlpR family DNA-binding transcription regulator [Kiritimatiellaeota bacterium B1221]